MWCPELADVPTDYIHDPWNLPAPLQKKLKITIGGTESDADSEVKLYPAPIHCTKYTSAEAARKIKRKSGVKLSSATTKLDAFLAKSK